MRTDLFVISGATKFVCQNCGRLHHIRLAGNKVKCKCGQKWEVSVCLGDPFAAMATARGQSSTQIGGLNWWEWQSGYLVKAVS